MRGVVKHQGRDKRKQGTLSIYLFMYIRLDVYVGVLSLSSIHYLTYIIVF